MKKYGLPTPEFYEERDSFKVIFKNIFVAKGAQSMETVVFKTKNSKLFEIPNSSKKIRKYVGLSSKSYVADSIIKPLLKAYILEYINKNSINARNQKYITVKNS